MSNLNFNKVILGGRLTDHPELKVTPNGTNVVATSVAVNRRGAKDGQQQTDFINIVAFKERAEFLSKYFSKGSSIFVEGELQTRKWKDKDGKDRYATEVIVSQIYFVDSKSENEAPSVIPGFKMEKTTVLPKFEDMDNDQDLPF